jgi:hypothetical protein
MSSAIQDLIVKKNYAKALDLIQAELRKRPKDVRLRLQQADALISAGRDREAIPVLMGLADEHASEGFTAKAIAFLKRIDKIHPGRQDVEERLSHLVQEKVSHSPTPAARPSPAFGLEEFDPSQEMSLGNSSGSSISLEEQPLSVAIESEAPIADDLDGLEAITIEEPPPPTSATQHAKSFLQTALFEGFEQAELAAVIRGLQFLSFQPGEIMVGEGAPGDSMFIIAEGTVKAYIKDRKGYPMMIKELSTGDFFGEVSVLTGKPRTATVTAATEVEVLELDKKTLDTINESHPRVRQVLEEFQKKRAQDAVEAVLSKGKGKK